MFLLTLTKNFLCMLISDSIVFLGCILVNAISHKHLEGLASTQESTDLILVAKDQGHLTSISLSSMQYLSNTSRKKSSWIHR